MYKANALGAGFRRYIPGLVALLALLLTVLMYASGLHGPFLLDDIGNLEPLKRWIDGDLGWQGVVFDNRSGPGGRPLSMLTFLVDAWFDRDLDTFVFKATNLGVHLATGVIAYALASLVFLQTRLERVHARWLAAFVAIAWLWLPMHVSTVLYVIQRMAQLATLLIFATLTLYMSARVRMENGSRFAPIVMWVGVPALTLLAATAKETGVLAIPLAAALEYTLFETRTRPRHVNIFFAITVALPALLGLAYVAIHPEWILGGYTVRDFTFAQRLMTEPRVLWSYLQTTFFPVGPRMGLFHDTYPVSISPWSPWTTTAALLAWLAIVCVAIAWRRRAPLLAFGVAGFLVAHSIEAGPISLELYFEHRNYGAALFALIAVVGLLKIVLDASVTRPRVRRILVVCAGACLAIYGLGTWSQVGGWRDATTFYAVQYGYNPESPRLLSSLTGRALIAHDLNGALTYIDQGERSGPAAEHPTATIWRFLAYCEVDQLPAPENLYSEFAERTHGRITTYAMVGWELLTHRLAEGCKSVDGARLASIVTRWLDTTAQPQNLQAVWRTRFNTGRIMAEAGHIEEARALVRRAWLDSDRNNGVGVLLFQLDASLNDAQGCQEVLASLVRAQDAVDHRLTEAVRTFRKALDSGEIGGTAQ